MATALKVLGQAYPTATVETALYTVPAATSTVVSSLVICNTSGTADTVTIRVAVGGAGSANKQLILSGVSLAGNSSISMTVGITLATADVIRVTSANGTSAFSAFGQENS